MRCHSRARANASAKKMRVYGANVTRAALLTLGVDPHVWARGYSVNLINFEIRARNSDFLFGSGMDGCVSQTDSPQSRRPPPIVMDDTAWNLKGS